MYVNILIWFWSPYILVWLSEQCVTTVTRGHQVGSWLSRWRFRCRSTWHWSERWKPRHGLDFLAIRYVQQTDPEMGGRLAKRSRKTARKEKYRILNKTFKLTPRHKLRNCYKHCHFTSTEQEWCNTNRTKVFIYGDALSVIHSLLTHE